MPSRLEGEPVAPRAPLLFPDHSPVSTPNPAQQFNYDLLHGRPRDRAVILRDARRHGTDLHPSRAVILTAPQPGEDPTEIARIIEGVVRYFHLPDDTMCAIDGLREVAVLKASDSAADSAPSTWTNQTALKRAARGLLSHLRR